MVPKYCQMPEYLDKSTQINLYPHMTALTWPWPARDDGHGGAWAVGSSSGLSTPLSFQGLTVKSADPIGNNL